MPRTLALLGLLAPLVWACSGPVGESAETVLTLQSGTMSELRACRGRGPFLHYDVPPREMMEVIGDAARKARGAGGKPVRAVFVNPHRNEVIAKERTAEEASDTGYPAPFRSAMLASVYPVANNPNASRVEIHAIERGPFHSGRVNWTRDMPCWINEVLAERRATR